MLGAFWSIYRGHKNQGRLFLLFGINSVQKPRGSFMSKFIALFCLVAITTILNFAQPALALDSNLKDQIAPFIEEIKSLQSQGVEMGSFRKKGGDLARCGKLMRSRQPIADALSDRISDFADSISIPSNDLAARNAINSLKAAASGVGLCTSCYSGASGDCNSVSTSLQIVQDFLNNN